ncbi:MAG TPA: LLM class flavin-dependent oxidoreductase [Pseudomonadales bacterium]
MKLGVTPWQAHADSASALAGQAARAEALGYHSFWVPESHFRGAQNTRSIPEPLMWLAAVAASTERLRLATTSLLLPLRHPLQAAEQVAVLDRLSGGRVILGIGRGYAAPMLRAFDVEPSEKRSLLEASLERMIEAWSGRPISTGGPGGGEMVLDPLPVQKPHPPVWMAAFGPKALDQAGRLGLPYLASPVEPLEVLAQNYHRHRQALAEHARPVPDEVPVMRTLMVTDGARETRALRDALQEQVYRQVRRVGGLPDGTEVQAWSIVGEPGYVIERVHEYRERLGVTCLIIARPRIPGLAAERAERSVVRAAELLLG